MNGEGRIETRETLPELLLNKGVRNRPWELDLPLRLFWGRSAEKDILLGQTHLKKMTLDELVNEGHPFKRGLRGMGFFPCEEKKPANAEKGTEKKEESVADPAPPSLPFRSSHLSTSVIRQIESQTELGARRWAIHPERFRSGSFFC
jgi:hypothetical protein